MKLLYILDEFPALSETFVLNQIMFLKNQKHEVKIVANKPRDEIMEEGLKKSLLENDIIYYNAPNNKLLKILKAIYRLIIQPKNWKQMLKSLNVFKYGKDVKNLNAFYVASVIDKNEKPDAIICHFGQNGKLGYILKEAGNMNSKVITIFHGKDISEYLKKHGNNTYDFLFNNGDLFLPISNYWRKKLIELGCPEDKIVVHRMGVEIEELNVSSSLSGDFEFKIISVGRLVEKKGFEYSIRSISELIKKGYNIQYSIIGGGPLYQQLSELISKLKVTDNIHLLGGLENEIVRKHINQSNLLITPSVTSETGDQEGIPVVIMEAVALKTPVIATNHTGIPELIVNNLSGLTVEEKDIKQLEKCTEYVIKNPVKMREYSNAAYNILKENFDSKKQNQAFEYILKNLIT